MHKKYTVKNGKTYGPYLYKNKRVGEKIITTYVGKDSLFKHNFNVLMLVVFSILIITGLILFYQSSPTARAVLDVDSSYSFGENLDGTLRLSLKSGELIPSNAYIVMTNGNQSISIPLSNLTEIQTSDGTFYAEGVNLFGEGQGFGTAGVKTVYPEVNFELLVSPLQETIDINETLNETIDGTTNETDVNQTIGSGGSDNQDDSENVTETQPEIPVEVPVEIPENDTENNQETQPETPIETPAEVIETQPETPSEAPVEVPIETAVETPEVSSENSNANSNANENANSNPSSTVSNAGGNSDNNANSNANENANQNPSSITGSAISEDEFIVQGSVSKDNDFTYNINENQQASVVSGSVNVNGSGVEDETVNLNINNGIVVVNTDYKVDELGFGQQYLNDTTTTLSINLNLFDIKAFSEELNIGLYFENVTILELNHTLQITDLAINQTLNETLNETFNTLSQIQIIPTIRIFQNSSVIIDLNDYFYGALNYSINLSSISGEIQASLLNLSAPFGFVGGTKAKIYASSENESIESNEFNVLVTSNLAFVSTFRSKIVVGEPVKWIKTLDSEYFNTSVIEIPNEAINYSIKKIEDVPELVEFEKLEKNKQNESQQLQQSIPSGPRALTGNVVADINTKKESRFIAFLRNSLSKLTGRVVDGENVSISELNETNSSIILQNESVELPQLNNSNVSIDVVNESTQVQSNQSDFVLVENASSYALEYYTEAPKKVEQESTLFSGKKVFVSAPDSLNYTDVIAFTDIDFSIGKNKTLKVYWKNYIKNESVQDQVKSVSEVAEVSEIVGENVSTVENVPIVQDPAYPRGGNGVFDQPKGFYLKEVPFDAYSLNSNEIDYIEWVVPHLSNQTFIVSDRTQITDCFSSNCLNFINGLGNNVAVFDLNGNIDISGDLVENHSIDLWPGNADFAFKIGPEVDDSVGFIEDITGDFHIKGQLIENSSEACDYESSNKFYLNFSTVCVGSLDNFGNLRIKGMFNQNALT